MGKHVNLKNLPPFPFHAYSPSLLSAPARCLIFFFLPLLPLFFLSSFALTTLSLTLLPFPSATPAASNAFAPGSVTMVSAAMIERGRSEATIGGRGLELRLEGGCQLVAETPRPNSPLSHLLAALLTLTKSLDHDLKFSKSSSDVLTGRRYVV